jgi:nucleotide-binding universal stress UspA family protein
MTTQTASKIITFDNILFATDFSKQSNFALPFALSIAHKYGSRIFATHVLAPPPLGNFPPIEIQALASPSGSAHPRGGAWAAPGRDSPRDPAEKR